MRTEQPHLGPHGWDQPALASGERVGAVQAEQYPHRPHPLGTVVGGTAAAARAQVHPAGETDAGTEKTSAAFAGEYRGSSTPPAPTRIRRVRPSTTAARISGAQPAKPGEPWCSAVQQRT